MSLPSVQQVVGQVDSEDHAQIWELIDSNGNGLNWTKPQLLFSKYGSFDRNRIILSLSGAWLFPMYYAGELAHNIIKLLGYPGWSIGLSKSSS